MKRFVFFASCLSTLFAACNSEHKEDSVALAQEKNVENFGTRDAEKDADFVVTTMGNSYVEIKLAQLAMNKSPDETLKNMANRIEEDNSKILNDLKDLSNKKGIAMPTEESKDTNLDVQELQNEAPEQFDKNWLKTIMDRQETSINHFESTQNNTQDHELKSWINETLPRLRDQRDSLKAYRDKLE